MEGILGFDEFLSASNQAFEDIKRVKTALTQRLLYNFRYMGGNISHA